MQISRARMLGVNCSNPLLDKVEAIKSCYIARKLISTFTSCSISTRKVLPVWFQICSKVLITCGNVSFISMCWCVIFFPFCVWVRITFPSCSDMKTRTHSRNPPDDQRTTRKKHVNKRNNSNGNPRQRKVRPATYQRRKHKFDCQSFFYLILPQVA